MRQLSIAILLAAAAVASAQDAAPDPDLAVLSGRVAPDAAGEVTLTLRRVVAREDGSTELAKRERTETVAPGGTFEFAGLPPCLYELTIGGKALATETRKLDVFGDVADLEITAARAAAEADVSVAGKLTLGFGGAWTDCKVWVDCGPVQTPCPVGSDGAFRCSGLVAGPAWVTAEYSKREPGYPIRETIRRRHVRATLAAGENTVDVHLEPDEDVRAVMRSKNAGEAVEGRVVDLDPSPYGPSWRVFRFEWPAEGGPRCSRWAMFAGMQTFGRAGDDLPLFGWAKGPHKLRVEAPGFERLERDVEVAGTTKLDLTLTPLVGDYFRPSVEGQAWWIEERRADGEWNTIASWESRFRSSHEGPPPVPVMFLAPGEHVLRAVRVGSAPSAPQKVQAGESRVERGVAFVFPEGRTLRGSLRTTAGGNLTGFRAYCFALVDEKLERERGHDFVADLDFTVTGLTKGRHVFAFDEKGEHPFAEFDMGEKDVTREFVYKAR